MKEVAIGLLGGFRISYDQSPITSVRSPRQQALLTWLLLHPGELQPRTRLASLFWPDVGEVQSRNNLRKLLHDLRDGWPELESFVEVSRDALTWRRAPDHSLDVDAFSGAAGAAETGTAISQAVSLYAGELLPDCYDDWVLPYRDRLQASFLDLLQRGVEVAEAQRDYRSAIRYAQRLLREEPLREGFQLSLIRLHALSGDRTGAVRAYHSCASVLKQELGIEPGVETRQLYRRLLDQEQPEVGGDVGPDVEPDRVVLVGRNKEWQTMQQTWRTALQGHASVIMMTGDPGAGKTRLAEELQVWAERQGLAVAHGAAYESEQSLPFGVISQLLRRQRTASRLSSLDRLWAREVSRLLPELTEDYTDLGDPGPLKESWQRRRLFEAIAHALLAIQPVILIVDDLQWCDSDSLLALEHLLRLDPTSRLLLLATVRLGSGIEETSTGYLELDGLGRFPGHDSVTIDLPPLDRHETVELATALDQRLLNALTDPASTEALYRESEGNPLFVVELVRAGWEAGNAPSRLPRTLEAAVRSRFVRLPDNVREVLDAAATLGTAFSVDVAGRVVRQDEADLVRAIDYLWRLRIIQGQRSGAADPRYEFSHGQIREVAYGDLSPVKRLMLPPGCRSLPGGHGGDRTRGSRGDCPASRARGRFRPGRSVPCSGG